MLKGAIAGLSMARTVILSPHQDDVAFSLGGSLLSGLFPRPIVYLNMFSVSAHTVDHAGIPDSTDITRLRTSEDEEFAKGLGLERFDLGFLDMHSGSPPYTALSSMLTGMPRRGLTFPEGLVRRLERTRSMTSVVLRSAARTSKTYPWLLFFLRSVLRRNSVTSLVAPLGLGNHPDHVVAAGLGRDLGGLVHQVFYYEDLPYAASYRLREIDRHVRFFDRRLRPLLVDTTRYMAMKLEGMSVYRSQMDRSVIAAVTRHAKRITRTGSAERIWTAGSIPPDLSRRVGPSVQGPSS